MEDQRTSPQTGASGETPATPPAGGLGRRTVAVFHDYAAAEAAVDSLADGGFPVEHVTIVGEGLRSVEQVTGRSGLAQAAGSGALSGAILGAVLGALFGLMNLFDPLASAVVLAFWGLLFGAIIGALLGLLGSALSGGRRDFSSVRTLQAARYEVTVDAAHADEAERRLASRV